MSSFSQCLCSRFLNICFTFLTVLTSHFLLLTFCPQAGLFPQFKDLSLW